VQWPMPVIPATPEAEAGGSQVGGQHGQHSNNMKKSCLKNKKSKTSSKDCFSCSIASLTKSI
jgi:hypothetical protein